MKEGLNLMLKIFTTQLMGVFQNIQKENEWNLEEGSRLVCQTIVSDGHVYVYGSESLQSTILTESLSGANSLPKSRPLLDDHHEIHALSSFDTVLLFSEELDESLFDVYSKIKPSGSNIIVISNQTDKKPSWINDVDCFLNLGVKGPLVPTDNGKKIGNPIIFASLYMYMALYLNIVDILEEQDFFRSVE